MLILNAGCGGQRFGPPFINLDRLREQLKPGTPERENLDRESNYVEADITQRLPFPDNHFDGCCALHVCEHLSCHQAADFLRDCRRILKPGGLLVVSVPDAEYFLKVHDRDTPENAVELFGEPISADEPWQKSFFDYALWKDDHLQVLTSPALRCILLRAGFSNQMIFDWRQEHMYNIVMVRAEIERIVNRTKFSVILHAIKSA